MASLALTPVYAGEETTEDITERSAGAEHECVRTGGECPFDPRTDYWSYNGSGENDDIVYWDQHGNLNEERRNTEFSIMNDISTFLTEEQMLGGFTLDSSIGVRDRNYVGGDPFTVEIKVTDGTTTYTDTQSYTMAAGQAYQTLTSQLVVPENNLAYNTATFGLILDGASLTNGYNGPETNDINLTATYAIYDATETVLDLVANTVDDIITDAGVVNLDSGQMDIAINTLSGNQNINVGVTTGASGITLSIPQPSGGTQNLQIASIATPSTSQPEQKTVSTAVAKVETAMKEQEQESSSESKEQKQESSKSTKSDKAKAVQAIVATVLEAVQLAGGDTDTTKLALMGVLGNQGFDAYQNRNIPDIAFYDTTVQYESPDYDDKLGHIFNLGSDQIMNDLIDSQYK